ncbi:MAG: glutathione S-transferase family protein [Rhodospirillales bacterium]|nr:glutathione S-transferase family protein [Rhodospirillales bacterium]
MLTIYGVYRSRASRIIWLANELGIPFKHVPVIQANRVPDPLAKGAPLNTQSPEFLKVNPFARIPSVDDGGLVLHESLAINLYLARKHGGPLAPATPAEDGQIEMWSFWAATEVEPHSIQVLYNMVGKPPAERDAKLAAASVEALRSRFAFLDGSVGAGKYLVGGRFTVADINVAEIVRYATPATALFDAAPNVKAWLADCQSRPAFKSMWATRDKEPA